MSKLAERVNDPEFQSGVRRHRAVLDFVTAIEDEMRARKITRAMLAERLGGKSRSWLSKIFRQKPNLTFFTAVDIADALGMDVEVRVVPRPPKHGAEDVRSETG